MLRGGAEFFLRHVAATLFFSTKTIFLRHQVLSEYVVLSMSEMDGPLSQSIHIDLGLPAIPFCRHFF